MKFVDEYRDRHRVEKTLSAIADTVTRPWAIMEICGGQTHAIVKYGIDQLLPDLVELVHGPGCPVCVTPVGMIDKAIELAGQENIILCSFGDMSRVPGTEINLLTAKARGADVQLVYSPLDAVKIARDNPRKEVVFFAVGFETTAPSTALAVKQAHALEIDNFFLLVAHVRVPPAMEVILSSPQCRIQGFLAAGHVCSVMGMNEYFPIANKFDIPIVITGFEPLDIVQGILMVVRQLEAQQHIVENQYSRVVQKNGNPAAQTLLNEVFEPICRNWRGIGKIAHSGLGLTARYAEFDAEQRFSLSLEVTDTENGCISGQVLQGIARPMDCANFGNRCTPDHPLGAPMVSTEGACAAYYLHRTRQRQTDIPRTSTT